MLHTFIVSEVTIEMLSRGTLLRSYVIFSSSNEAGCSGHLGGRARSSTSGNLMNGIHVLAHAVK
jgi:hypothetical protein